MTAQALSLPAPEHPPFHELSQEDLRYIYDNDPDESTRKQAGQALGYSMFRIAWKEHWRIPTNGVSNF